MAQKTTVHLVDDLDGSEADETVAFALDGTSYEIDLSADHAADMRDAFAPYVGAARRAPAGGGRRAAARRSAGASASASDRQRTAEIRQWARDSGMEVNERGRIPSRVIEAYEAAH